jgi:hypothetical protein
MRYATTQAKSSGRERSGCINSKGSRPHELITNDKSEAAGGSAAKWRQACEGKKSGIMIEWKNNALPLLRGGQAGTKSMTSPPWGMDICAVAGLGGLFVSPPACLHETAHRFNRNTSFETAITRATR